MVVTQSLAKKINPTTTIATVLGIMLVLFVFFRVINKTTPLHQVRATAEEELAARYALFLEMKERMFYPEETYRYSIFGRVVNFSKSINGTCSEITELPESIKDEKSAMAECAIAGDNINNFQQPCFGVLSKRYGGVTYWFACLSTVPNRNSGTWLRANLAQGHRPKTLNSQDYANYVKTLSKEDMMDMCAATPDCVGIRVDPNLGYVKCQETQMTYNSNNDYWILESEAKKGNVGRLLA
jgi:hypothetical protein